MSDCGCRAEAQHNPKCSLYYAEGCNCTPKLAIIHCPMHKAAPQMREALEDLAEHGTRHDLMPTCDQSGEPPRTGWYGYIAEMDAHVRQRARAALKED